MNSQLTSEMPQYWPYRVLVQRIGVILLVAGWVCSPTPCPGDAYVIAPSPGPSGTGTIIPFLIKETDLASTPPLPSMRYQQVCDSSLFTNLTSDLIYVTTITFFPYSGDAGSIGWTIPSMQVNLSTTSKTADTLSMVFSDNVGPDDTVVLDPTSYYFPGNRDVLLFNRPFRFRPPLGNLLIDVRIFDGSGPPFPDFMFPKLQAYSAPTDQVSRVWSTNVAATVATGSDSVGLDFLIQLSPIPALKAEFDPVYAGTLSNMIKISWPSEPTNFVLQTSRSFGSGTAWGPVTNQILGDPGPYGSRFITIPAGRAGGAAFYRLVWPAGVSQDRQATRLSPGGLDETNN